MQSSAFLNSGGAMRLFSRIAPAEKDGTVEKAMAESQKATTALRDAIRRLNESCDQDRHIETEVARHAAETRG